MKLLKDTTTLKEHQVEHSTKLAQRRRALYVEKAGKGKSLSCLSAFCKLKEHNKVTNMLVMTPRKAYMEKVWESEVLKFTHLKVIDIEVVAKRIETHRDAISKILDVYDIIYAKHSHLKNYASILKLIVEHKQTILCVDEVHAFKNPRSAMTKLARMYLRGAYARWALSATPLSRNLEDTYNIVDFTTPGFFGSFDLFRQLYCKLEKKVIGRLSNGARREVFDIVGIRDLDEWNKKLEPLVIKGEGTIIPHFNYVDYQLSAFEESIYRKISHGLDLDTGTSNEDWLKSTIRTEFSWDTLEVDYEKKMKEIERHSSRFIYLQAAADGILDSEGNQNRIGSSKMNKMLEVVQGVVDRKESILIYFDYYTSLDVAKRMLANQINGAVILEASGRKTLKHGDISPAKCARTSHIILCTKAATESVSYFYIKNLMMFNIPTTPVAFTQFVGRITRVNTLFPNDLQVFIMRSDNIDLYKLYTISMKSQQMELVTGKEYNIPETYKELSTTPGFIASAKKSLLWVK